MIDLRNYAVVETLNGAVVTGRAAPPGDGSKIRTAFEDLASETVYTRFFGYKSEVTDAELDRITSMDFAQDVALHVTIGCGLSEIVIGDASYVGVRVDQPDRSAELAFAINQDYQGLGIASSLMRHLVGIAR